jgi:death-on-curing protein
VELTVYLTLEEALHLHERLIQRYGGTLGVRDRGLVESALARPRSGYYETLSEQAAALLHSFATNRAFVDGNKRVAWAVTAVFLRLNGFRVEVQAAAAETFLIERAIQGRADVREIAAWLEACMRVLPAG